MLDRTQQFRFGVAQHGDALELLQSLPGGSAALVHLDPQHRSNLNYQKYGNEGARQRERCALPQMSDDYIDQCCREAARVLRPSAYLLLWADTFRLCQAHHLRVADVLPCVDLVSWNSEKPGSRLPCSAVRRLLADLAEKAAARAGDLDRSPHSGSLVGASRPANSSPSQADRASFAPGRRRHQARRPRGRSRRRQLHRAGSSAAARP